MKWEDIASEKRQIIIDKALSIQKDYPSALRAAGGNKIKIVDVIVCGSHAYGNARKESDLDLIFVTDKNIYPNTGITPAMDGVWREYFYNSFNDRYKDILIELNFMMIAPSNYVSLFTKTDDWGMWSKSTDVRLGISLLRGGDIYCESDWKKICKKRKAKP